MRKNVVAIVTADLHLSSKPPIARSAEPCWLKAQARQLAELRCLADEHQAPIIIAGDIYDRPTCSPELINFTFRHLPRCYAVAGNHDLLFHAYADIRKTAYWTLVEGGLVTNLPPSIPVEISSHGLRLHGFPYSYPPRPLTNPHDLFQEIAVVHHYIWNDGHGHPGAAKEDYVKTLQNKLLGYEAAVFGDNHQSFQFRRLFNCGGFYRRRSDDITHRSSVGLLHKDGKITRHYLDVSKDVFASPDTIIESIQTATGADLDGFIAELGTLGDALIDWTTALRRYMKKNKVRPEVRRTVLKALEE